MKLYIVSRRGIIEREYSCHTRLYDAIRDSGVDFDAPCGGRGVCGNCRVKAYGSLSEPAKEELAFLGESVENGFRLACFTYLRGDATVILGGDTQSAGAIGAGVAVSPVTGSKKCFALAIDVGTTEVGFNYYSLPDGLIVKSESVPNSQSVFGADVMSRIAFAAKGGADELRLRIERVISDSIDSFGEKIEFSVVTGNTAMLHMLSGRDASRLGVSPFATETLFGFWDGDRYYMRCISAFVGADTTAAVLSTGMTGNAASVLCDIGTNNETALWDGKHLYCCSSPAGPAFEGGNISCGMTAREGAIYAVENANGHPIVRTVGGKQAFGICGSGLTDAVAFLLDNNYVNRDGSVEKKLPRFSGVELTPHDISEYQLAKAAVCSGIEILCQTAKATEEEIKTLYLAGGLGCYVNPTNAERTGMIPSRFAKKSVICGNASLAGASLVLLNEGKLHESEGIAKSAMAIELANSENFEQVFIENLFFPDKK